jgi:hypothetical membrane protein
MSDNLSTTVRPAPSRPSGRLSPRARALLACGVVAGPIYVLVGLTEALTRRGFDLAHDDLSLLSNGPLGWIHISLFVLTGVLVVLGAVGMAEALGGLRATRAPALIGVFGAGLVGAGVFVADPMGSFPPGTPPGRPAHVSLHGTGHFVTAALGFLGLLIACALFARHFRRDHERGLAGYSAGTGVVFLTAFVGIASGSTATPVVIGFWIGVILAFTWLSVVCARLRRGDVRN